MSEREKTQALLVGIEKYEAGKEWDLKGPAMDVHRIAKWLQDQCVPAKNLKIFLSPLDENTEIVTEIRKLTAHEIAPATRENIENELTRQLPSKSASLFFFYWGGHGWVTQEGARRLYYADATDNDRRNLDFNDLLVTMHSDQYKKSPKQLFIVDTCANYLRNVDNKYPSCKLSKGDQVPSQEQFALFAAQSGDRAKNLDIDQTGLYTRELLTELHLLEPNETWPPDMNKISAGLQRKFIELRNQGKTKQTPTYLWNRPWTGEGLLFGQMSVASGDEPLPSPLINLPRKLSTTELSRIRDAFLGCASLQDLQKRHTIVYQLRQEIWMNINQSGNINADVINIFQTARNYLGGLQELLESINFFESDSIKFKNLKQTIFEIIPEEVNEQH
jgi:hypothetical protein